MMLGEFLTVLQEVHHVEEERAEDVRQQRVEPKRRDPAVLRNEAQIIDLKVYTSN